MKLTLLGTGCPVPSLRRHGPSQVVEAGEALIMIDCGAGTLHRLVEAGLMDRPLSHIFFTHLHSDHVTGLMDVLWAGWIRRLPPTIYGPPGTRHFIEHVYESMAYDSLVRGGDEGTRPAPPVVEIEEGLSVSGSDWQLRPFRVDHRPVDQAFGYRVDQGSKALVFSGDTCPCDNLVSHAEGADMLVHEVYLAEGLSPPPGGYPNDVVRRRMELLSSYHTSSMEVGRVATDSGAKHLVLSHIYTGRIRKDDPAALVRDIQPDYRGRLDVGEDLDCFDLA